MAERQQVNLNADCGESYGAWRMGDDAALMPIIASANVACGFHGGDPLVMRATVELAAAGGTSIGAHPSLDDLRGFGRRRIDVRPAEVEALVAYQIGALAGIAAMSGQTVTHVKPHGSLNNMAAEDADLADAIARAIKGVDPRLIFLSTAGSEMSRAGRRLGLRVAEEVFADRTYDERGNLTSRKLPNAMIHDEREAVAHVLRMVREQAIFPTAGGRIPTEIHSVCVHGDEPSAIRVAGAVRRALEEDGIAVVPLPAMEALR
jgi:5-oxoprolinase (ATP-hydrolysing) subunit A